VLRENAGEANAKQLNTANSHSSGLPVLHGKTLIYMATHKFSNFSPEIITVPFICTLWYTRYS